MFPYIICYIFFSLIIGIFSFYIEFDDWESERFVYETERPGLLRFILGMLLWPASLVIIIFIFFKKARFKLWRI